MNFDPKNRTIAGVFICYPQIDCFDLGQVIEVSHDQRKSRHFDRVIGFVMAIMCQLGVCPSAAAMMASMMIFFPFNSNQTYI